MHFLSKQLITYIIVLLSVQIGFGQFSYYFGTEQYGASSAVRTLLDTQANTWKLLFGTNSYTLPYSFTASTPSSIYTITPGSGYQLDVSFRDMTGTVLGSLATTNATINSTTNLQANSPKPLSRLNEGRRGETAGASNSKNAFLIELNQSFLGIGFWIGDIETRTDGQGTGALIQLFDASNTLLDSKIIETSTIDQSLCGNPANPSGSEFNGCGNNGGRWIGISNLSGLDVRKIVVIVGDDDSGIGINNGNTESLSFMGGYIVSCLTNVESCNNIDDDCDGAVDEDISPILSDCSAGTGACLMSGTITTSCVAGALSASTCNAIPGTPSTETCDNIDNDCDGTIDESLTQATSCGVGACQIAGTESCVAGIRTGNSCIAGAAGLESCNNIDDDCDGSIDEDITPVITSCSAGTGACSVSGSTTTTCVAGSLSTSSCSAIPSSPSTEICDNLDNDCDGSIDESLSQATSCGVGVCQMAGTEACVAGVWTGNSCIAGAAGMETCNNIDDDCDGAVDEDIAPILSDCSAGTGACLMSGTITTSCVAGTLSNSTCNAIPGTPSTETCDNIDNDCDGAIDEGNICISTPPSEIFGGGCIVGFEICDGKDNDCDNSIDEGCYQTITIGTNPVQSSDIQIPLPVKSLITIGNNNHKESSIVINLETPIILPTLLPKTGAQY